RTPTTCADARTIARLCVRERRRRVRSRSGRAGQSAAQETRTARQYRNHPHRARRGLSLSHPAERLMREQSGLPIAAHLGLLVALAFVSAFIGIVTVVIWLPPRPPD